MDKHHIKLQIEKELFRYEDVYLVSVVNPATSRLYIYALRNTYLGAHYLHNTEAMRQRLIDDIIYIGYNRNTEPPVYSKKSVTAFFRTNLKGPVAMLLKGLVPLDAKKTKHKTPTYRSKQLQSQIDGTKPDELQYTYYYRDAVKEMYKGYDFYFYNINTKQLYDVDEFFGDKKLRLRTPLNLIDFV